MTLLRDTIYQSIRRAILICEYKPGQELREQMLAERYRVSRSPIRDALLRLQQENLVTVLPRRGYRVKPISIPDAEDLFALRLLLEPALCHAAAAGADDVELQTLDHFRGFATKDPEDPVFGAYNGLFHRKIAELSGNSRSAAFAGDLIAQFERLERVVARETDREADRRACEEHEAIIDALQAHDADRATRLAHEHIEIARSGILTALSRLGREAAGEAGGTGTAERIPR